MVFGPHIILRLFRRHGDMLYPDNIEDPESDICFVIYVNHYDLSEDGIDLGEARSLKLRQYYMNLFLPPNSKFCYYMDKHHKIYKARKSIYMTRMKVYRLKTHSKIHKFWDRHKYNSVRNIIEYAVTDLELI